MRTRVSYLSLVKEAKRNGFNVTCPWDASYQKDMTIWNRRLQTGPAMVAFCKKTEDVQLCVQWCRENGAEGKAFPLRVRSGGHHHEGMSCDYGVLIIDLSLMNQIRYVSPDRAWIPAGKQLQHVYAELKARGQIIPGGGCETVCVGGLTLGGGWGMSARPLGLTCDNILEAEIVMADGSVRNVKAGDRLFWGLQGGGAGNFGIVTSFLFKLTNATPIAHDPQTWHGSDAKFTMRSVTESIANNSISRSMTVACRLFVDGDAGIAFRLMSQTLETRTQADEMLSGLTGNLPPASSTAAQGGEALLHVVDSKIVGSPSSGPDDTCKAGPLPHKVSSAFVKRGKEMEAADLCYAFLRNHNKSFPNAASYISFHSFGGAIGDIRSDETAFPYRDRMLLLQFQAWWNDPADESSDQYIDWVRDARTALAAAGLTDGGFFNFQDASVVPGGNRHALMNYYYGPNLDRLIDLKIEYDPNDVFQSGMSIPNRR